MKIESSNIGLASQHASSRQVTVKESLRAWIGPQRPDFENRASKNDSIAAPLQLTVATLSAAGKQAAASAQSAADACSASEAQNAAEQASSDPKIQLLIGLIEVLTGRKIRLFNPNDMKVDGDAQARTRQAADAARQNQTAPPAQRHGWGVEYDRHESVHESEQTAFAAQGVIKTSDGKEIQFSLSLEMKREFFRESDLSIREGDGVRKDPLIINFNGTSAQLTDTKFSFDLDSDGNAEKISFTGAGSGFLALDKNGNGIIDNGSELFGTQSGNGFADLSAYDIDGNNWIDESDAIYSKLQVWNKNAAGENALNALTKFNVGALYLGNVATPFDLKNSANDLQGQVRSSGIYVREDGSTGTLQQVDLVV
ncbi:MAG: hypothetical protein WAW10_11275 [Gallionella sp.]